MGIALDWASNMMIRRLSGEFGLLGGAPRRRHDGILSNGGAGRIDPSKGDCVFYRGLRVVEDRAGREALLVFKGSERSTNSGKN